ncbi:hypothetical protein FKM82_024018 [Ascaphus truei]
MEFQLGQNVFPPEDAETLQASCYLFETTQTPIRKRAAITLEYLLLPLGDSRPVVNPCNSAHSAPGTPWGGLLQKTSAPRVPLSEIKMKSQNLCWQVVVPFRGATLEITRNDELSRKLVL